MAPKGKTPAQLQQDADDAKRKADESAADVARRKASDDQMTAIQGSLTNLTTQLAEMGGRVNVLATERINPTPTPTTARGFQRTVTADQIRAARDEGDNSKADAFLMTYNTETIQESMQGVSSQIQALQHQGVAMIANVVKEQTSAKLPHYERFKKEIDEFLDKAPMESRTSPEMHKWAHDSIVGRHTDELMKEAADAAVRKHMDGGGGYKPGEGGSGGTGGGSTGDLTIDNVYEDDAKDIKRLLRDKNMSLAQYASRRGFADEQAYLKHVKKFRDDQRLEAM